MSLDDYVHVLVGGLSYSITVSDIEKFPGSFLQCMVKKEWQKSDGEPIAIQRDGKIFRFVYSFLVNGHLPRNRYGELTIDDETMLALAEEADFYGLTDLSKECNTQLKCSSVLSADSYFSLKEYAKVILWQKYSWKALSNYEYTNETCSELFSVLKSIWAPFCVRGKLCPTIYNLCFPENNRIYKSSTFTKLNVNQLIAKGVKCSDDVKGQTGHTLEIDCARLDRTTCRYVTWHTRSIVHQLAPHLTLSIHERKIVIHQEGYAHDWSHVLPTPSNSNHIGTLVVILNSQYTGGELEVTHGGRTEVVTGPYSWVAMYGDCLHKINPVTSGTRVSLIYDIYSSPADPVCVWDEGTAVVDPILVKRNRLIGPEMNTFLCNSVAQELTQFDTILITLQHLYPEGENINAAILKGGDRALYNVFTAHPSNTTADPNSSTSPDNSTMFAVQVIHATIYYHYDTVNVKQTRLCMATYSTDIVSRALKKDKADEMRLYKKDVVVNRMKHLGKYKLLAPVRMHILTHKTARDSTDLSDPTAGEAVYLVSCLQVRLKE